MKVSFEGLPKALKLLAPHGIAFFVLCLYGIVQWHILTTVVPIPDGMRDIVMRSLGTLDAAMGIILSWYFGSQNVDHPATNTTVSTVSETTTEKRMP